MITISQIQQPKEISPSEYLIGLKNRFEFRPMTNELLKDLENRLEMFNKIYGQKLKYSLKGNIIIIKEAIENNNTY